MAHDGKYGRVTTEFGDIPDNEQVIVFRGQDKVLPDLLKSYYDLCVLAGSPQKHLDIILDARKRILNWQAVMANTVKVPSSEGDAGRTYWERNK